MTHRRTSASGWIGARLQPEIGAPSICAPAALVPSALVFHIPSEQCWFYSCCISAGFARLEIFAKRGRLCTEIFRLLCRTSTRKIRYLSRTAGPILTVRANAMYQRANAMNQLLSVRRWLILECWHQCCRSEICQRLRKRDGMQTSINAKLKTDGNP